MTNRSISVDWKLASQHAVERLFSILCPRAQQLTPSASVASFTLDLLDLLFNGELDDLVCTFLSSLLSIVAFAQYTHAYISITHATEPARIPIANIDFNGFSLSLSLTAHFSSAFTGPRMVF